MKRRDFLKFAAYSPAVLGSAAGLSSMSARAALSAGSGSALFNNAVINIMLLGGADLRFLFVPAPGTAYADRFWQARRDLYLVGGASYPDYLSVWNELYLPTTDPVTGAQFGIHKNAAWLKAQFDLGNAAIAANVIGAQNRRHDHAQLIVHTGDPTTGQFDYDRDGWGGRLAHAIGSANTVVVSRSVPVDSFIGADLFQLRCAHMEYGGWDHHRLLKSRFEPMIADLFGTRKGLDTLSVELDLMGAGQFTTFVVNTDFGRQLAANGDNGTDHGRGNYSILIGPSVSGGVYGEMFPQNEISQAMHANHLSQPGSDIEGRTALENVMAAACNWVEPGAGNAVFSPSQSRRADLVENGVSLGTLFA